MQSFPDQTLHYLMAAPSQDNSGSSPTISNEQRPNIAPQLQQKQPTPHTYTRSESAPKLNSAPEPTTHETAAPISTESAAPSTSPAPDSAHESAAPSTSPAPDSAPESAASSTLLPPPWPTHAPFQQVRGSRGGPGAAPFDPNPLTSTSQHTMITRSIDGTRRPKVLFATRHPIPLALTSTLQNHPIEPSTYKQAMNDPHWRQAMTEEFDALQRNGTWTLVPLTPSMNVVGCKWVYKLKHRADGSIERYKARLVAKGFNQREGFDFEETFSPVVKSGTVRLILSLALSRSWPIRQLDVKNAFLHGDLNEVVYLQQPPGFIDPTRPTHVCHLHKALYGLRQAPRAWYTRFTNFLLQLGFICCPHDTSLFMWHQGSSTILVLLYVDDLIITGTHDHLIFRLIRHLSSQFDMKDLGPLNFFLGMQVVRNNDSLVLSQTQYAINLLHRFGLSGVKPIKSPLEAGLHLSSSAPDPLPDPTVYRQMVGSLQYLTMTRPDIAHAVNHVCQFMHKPCSSHLAAVKRIFRYVKGTLSFGLRFSKDTSLQLRAFSDADWAGCPDSRRSTTGYAVFMGPNLLSWGSKKQSTVSRSSAEAEYRALASTTTEVLWFLHMLRFLGVHLSKPPLLLCDNVSAIHMSKNPVFHSRTKHIDIDVHFIRAHVLRGAVTLSHLPGKVQVADIFTKSLPSPRFLWLRDKLSLRAHPSSA